MAVCPIPLPDGFSYLLSLFSFIISYSFSFFSSSGFLFHPLSSSPSLYRLVAHFGLAGASSIQQQLQEIQSSRVATAVENPLHFALPGFQQQSQEQGCPFGPDFNFGSIPYTFKGKKKFVWSDFIVFFFFCCLGCCEYCGVSWTASGVLGSCGFGVSFLSVWEPLPMLCSCCFVQPFLGVVPSTEVRQLTVGATTYFPVFRSLDTD